MAHAGVGDLDQHLALLRRGDIDLDDLQGFSSLEGDGSAGFHGHDSQVKGKSNRSMEYRPLSVDASTGISAYSITQKQTAPERRF
jgi:hypothetical protein